MIAGVGLTVTGGMARAQDRPLFLPGSLRPSQIQSSEAGAIPGEPAGPDMSLAGAPANDGGLVVPSWWARCKQCLRRYFIGFPEEFEAPPLGASVYACNRIQVANAEAARMVLGPYHFVEGTDQLSALGRTRLQQIAHFLPCNFYPVVIEATCHPELDLARRLAVANELGHGRFAIPLERVVIGPALTPGLSGLEARFIYANLVLRTQAGGAPVGAGGGAGAGLGRPGSLP
jgi:hypothetical protein